ncbi:hypothetical protein B0H11DRAFT_1927240 [Mycena galericulata]|nr:hypothetical protein B0H11DRAFT_1927240 [Mycena galericulata]
MLRWTSTVTSAGVRRAPRALNGWRWVALATQSRLYIGGSQSGQGGPIHRPILGLDSVADSVDENRSRINKFPESVRIGVPAPEEELKIRRLSRRFLKTRILTAETYARIDARIEAMNRLRNRSCLTALTSPIVSATEPAAISVARLPELPPPEEFTGPLLESDFPQYIVPLYDRGWQFSFNRPYPNAWTHSTLRRKFTFPSIGRLIKFSQNTRDVTGATVAVCRNMDTEIILLPPPRGLTRDDIRLAVQIENEYVDILGAHYSANPTVGKRRRVESLKTAQELRRADFEYPAEPTKYIPIVPASLPPSPPVPSGRRRLGRAVTKADLQTYLKPLIASGWSITSPRIPFRSQQNEHALLGHPCLHRVYYFLDYATARDFLHVALTLMPPPTPMSLAGVELRLRTTSTPGVHRVLTWSISELKPGPGAPNKYGVALADVHFAIELETEVYKNWLGRAHTPPRDPDPGPNTLGELWKHTNKRLANKKPRPEGASP